MSDAVPQTLDEALMEAQRQAHFVEKAGKNSFHGYKYAKAEDMMAEGRGVLLSFGLLAQCVGWEILPPIADGHPERVKVKYELRHPASKEVRAYSTETSAVPEKGRPWDKAEAAALTYSLGYFIRGLLMLPRVEEGADVDQRHDRSPKQAPAQVRKPEPSLEEKLQESSEILSLAEKIRKALAKEPSIKELEVTWKAFCEIDKGRWPKKVIEDIVTAKNTRKLQLANNDRAAE